MSAQFERLELLLGENAVEKFSKIKIAIFGLGDVGCYVAEALARCNFSNLSLFDSSNILNSDIQTNLLAFQDNIGQNKAIAMSKRINNILDSNLYKNNVKAHTEALTLDYIDSIDFSQFNYVIDALQDVSYDVKAKIIASAKNCPVICTSDFSGCQDLQKIVVTDISKCGKIEEANKLRLTLRTYNIKHCKIICSLENKQKNKPASMFITSLVGFTISSVVIKSLADR